MTSSRNTRTSWLCVLAALLTGCISQGELQTTLPPETAKHTFHETLQKCRLQQPGRLNRRVHLPPTSPGVARCLMRRGWNPDGTPRSPDEHTRGAADDHD